MDPRNSIAIPGSYPPKMKSEHASIISIPMFIAAELAIAVLWG